MRILVTVPWPERLGGAEAMLQTILEGVRGSGHEIELVFFEDGPWPRELAGSGFPVQVIEAGRVRQLHRWLATVWRLVALLRRRRPDVLLNWAAKTQVYGAPAAILAGMSDRIVWFQHSVAAQTWLERIANVLPARAIICYSQEAARAQARMRPPRPILVIPAGGSARAFADLRPAELADAARLPVIGIVGRLQPWKGQDRLIEAAALLRGRGRAVHLLLVGGDSYGLSPDYAAALPRKIRELGLDEQSRWWARSRRPPVHGQHGRARQRLRARAVRNRAARGHGRVGLPIVAVDAGGPPRSSRTVAPASSRARAHRRTSLTRSSRCSPPASYRASLGAAGRELGSSASTPTPRSASASSQRWSRSGPAGGPTRWAPLSRARPARRAARSRSSRSTSARSGGWSGC